jgi:hypothetical protein
LFVSELPLLAEQMAHHLLAAGDGLGLHLIQRRVRHQLLGVEGGQIDAVERCQSLGGLLIVNATDQDTQASHGILQNGGGKLRALSRLSHISGLADHRATDPSAYTR